MTEPDPSAAAPRGLNPLWIISLFSRPIGPRRSQQFEVFIRSPSTRSREPLPPLRSRRHPDSLTIYSVEVGSAVHGSLDHLDSVDVGASWRHRCSSRVRQALSDRVELTAGECENVERAVDRTTARRYARAASPEELIAPASQQALAPDGGQDATDRTDSHNRCSAASRPAATSFSNVVTPGSNTRRALHQATAPEKIAFGPSPVIHA